VVVFSLTWFYCLRVTVGKELCRIRPLSGAALRYSEKKCVHLLLQLWVVRREVNDRLWALILDNTIIDINKTGGSRENEEHIARLTFLGNLGFIAALWYYRT
jgi:hypothetical protein